MSFYERYENLCAERGMKPQNPEMQRICGVTSGSISGWKSGSSPKIEVLCRLATYFDVTTDYLLGLSEVRKPEVLVLSEKEKILIDAYRAADDMGQLNIIYICLDEMKKAKGDNASAV